MTDDSPKIAPAYEVEAVPDFKYPVRVLTSVKDKSGKHTKFDTAVEERIGGYMVYFPGGHSLHVRDDATLAQLGLNTNAALIDMQTGEPVGSSPKSLKTIVDSKTRARN